MLSDSVFPQRERRQVDARVAGLHRLARRSVALRLSDDASRPARGARDRRLGGSGRGRFDLRGLCNPASLNGHVAPGVGPRGVSGRSGQPPSSGATRSKRNVTHQRHRDDDERVTVHAP
jgi:hypothetical protein